MEDHTYDNYMNTFYFPRSFNRKRFETWEEEGSRDICSILNERAKAIFNDHKPQKLPEEVKQTISAIVEKHRPDVN
jgi:trimethylamine:corrinoid methyltransferase-like protein